MRTAEGRGDAERRGEIGRELAGKDGGPGQGARQEIGQRPPFDLVGDEGRRVEEGHEGKNVADPEDGHDDRVQIHGGNGAGRNIRGQETPVDESEDGGQPDQERHEQAPPAPDHALERQVEDRARRTEERKRPSRVSHRATR